MRKLVVVLAVVTAQLMDVSILNATIDQAESMCECLSLREELAREKEKNARLEEELVQERASRKLIGSFFFGSKLLRCVELVRDLKVGDEAARVRVGKKDLEIEIFESPAPRKAGEFVTVARIAQLSEGFSLVNEPCTPRKK
ncbi:MAG: hypothetical protein KBD16_00385 [Candidatus Pacebacteria bacterium]|nr:hypothetical protein [Candidatus Paceibacterota bacterium]